MDGQAGRQELVRIIAAEQALDADQRENPKNPSAVLAKAYAASYDLRTSMIDDFLESKREKPPPHRKPAKKSCPAKDTAE